MTGGSWRQVEQKSAMSKALEYLTNKERIERAGTVQPRGKTTRGSLNGPKLLMGGSKDAGAALWSRDTTDRAKGSEQKLKYKTFCLDARKKKHLL